MDKTEKIRRRRFIWTNESFRPLTADLAAPRCRCLRKRLASLGSDPKGLGFRVYRV